MAICPMCEAIAPELFQPKAKTYLNRFSHHPSFKSLETSAHKGCNVCSLIYSSIYNKRHVQEYQCAGTGGPDDPPIEYSYSGLSGNSTVKEGHRTYISVSPYRKGENDRGYPVSFLYKIGQNGVTHEFDLEYSDDQTSSLFYPRSDRVFEVLNGWLRECVISHEECPIKYDPDFKPTRLIDVGRRGVSPRLVLTSASAGDFTKYLALSHRWGTSMPDTAITTTKTIAKRLSRLPIKSLPRTFQDAIIATRKLKSQYLWVDSLCILQDSPSDWQQESARMGKVYSHSFCMIAAAASPDSNGGIFPLRSELPILGAADPVMPSRLVVLKKSFTSSGWSGLFRSSGLNYRGWTLQERELSPRILYFTKHTILFECKESRAGNPEKLRRSIELTSKEDLELHPQVRRCLDRFYRKDHGRGQYTEYKGRRYDFWFDMIEGYSTRQLSMKTDKFPGISGLASEYAYQLNDQYVAGLWRNDLCRGLSWRLLKKGSTKFSRKQARSVNTETSIYGPSWSWAKMDHPVSYEIVRRKDKFLDGPIDQGLLFKNPEILEIFVVPEGKDPNGTLISASIHLYGQLLTTYISRLGTCNIWGESVPISWDSLPQTLPKRSVIHLLNLSNTGSALVLTFVPRLPTELEHPGARRFKRIGIVPTIDRRWFQEFEMEEMVLI